jgi:hypothetical protein
VQLFKRPWQRMAFEIVMIGITIFTIINFSKHTQDQMKELQTQVKTLQQALERIVPKP